MGMEVDDRRERLNLAEAQYQASSTIYGTSDPVEILNAVVNFGGKAFAEAHLALLDPDTQILNSIAVRDGDGIRAAQGGRRPEDYPAFDTLSAVEVLHVADVETDPFLTNVERARAQANGIGALLVIPLVVAQRLTGLIGFSNPTPVEEIPQHRLRALRNLGDQIAVVFENQALLRSTATTLDEVQALYDINREMLGALDPLTVLRVLRDHLAKSASAITYAVVGRDANGAETVTIRYIATPTAEQAVEIPLAGLNLAASAPYSSDPTSVVFVEDVTQSETPLHSALQLKDARSYIIILVRERGVVEDIIAVAYDRAEVFDSRTRRLFTAIADQIGIVLQNQRLLENARLAAHELAQQVQVLQGLNRLSSGISSFRTEKELLDYATLNLTTALGVDHVGIVLFEPQEDLGVVVSEYPDHGAVGSKIETRNSAMIKALLEAPDHPVVIQDVNTAPLLEPETREVLNRIGVVSMMIMALQSAGQIVGTVGFDMYSHAHPITPTIIETAETMIAQVAIGLQNQRLLNDAQRLAAQLQHVTTFGQEMQSALKIDAILTIMLTESRVMLSIDRMTI
ncbi:MAG: GAF domain-containing protein, partial [Anaerolineae bacterium]|nr:GAF domain-containing protein [Anaerolineae bacterium]